MPKPKPRRRLALPYVAFTNDELEILPPAKPGDSFTCPVCGLQHTLESGKTPTGVASVSALFYRCSSRLYLGAVAGRLVVQQVRQWQSA